jgi:hypothetical protein
MLEIKPQQLPIAPNEKGDETLLVTVCNSCLPEPFLTAKEVLFTPADFSEPWPLAIEESAMSKWPWLLVSLRCETPSIKGKFWINANTMQGAWSF